MKPWHWWIKGFLEIPFIGGECLQVHWELAITIPEDEEEIDMHYAEQVWKKEAEENERRRNIGIFIDGCLSFGIKQEAIASKLVELYKLSYTDAMSLIKSRPDTNVSQSAL